MLDSKRI